MILSNDFGIDPGSTAIKIYDRGNESFYSDYNALACDADGRVIAWGEEAYNMRGSTPKSISVKTSVVSGKITDILLLDSIVEQLLYKEHRFLGIRPTICFSVPSDMTEIEKRAYASVSRRSRLKNCDVFLVESAYADALALGLSIKNAKGIMILNIGGSQATASVISNGRIILERSIPLGGEVFTNYILASIRKKNSLSIGYLAAEKLKKDMCDLTGQSGGGVQIYGLDTLNGLPRDGFITARTVSEAVRVKLDELVLLLEDFIHRIPPQVLEYVKNEGIYVTGGSSAIPGMEEYLRQKLRLPVNVSDLYEYSTVKGIKEILGSVEYQSLPKAPVGRRKK